MMRLNLFEFEDQRWLPRGLRVYMTDFLRALFTLLPVYQPASRILAAALQRSGQRAVVDLCSGSAGPWPLILPELEKKAGPISLAFTDRFPEALKNAAAQGESAVMVVEEPVDARAVPVRLRGLRTLFTAAHHFSPEEMRRIISDACVSGYGIACFEITSRTLRSHAMVMAVPLLVMLLSLFIRPLTFSRLFWTYAVPVVPLLCFADGILSNFRSYRVQELYEIAQTALGSDMQHRFKIESGTARSSPFGAVTYLVCVRETCP